MSDDMFYIIIILLACILFYALHKKKHLLYGCGIPEKENYGEEEIYDDNYDYLDDITMEDKDKNNDKINYKIHPYFVEMQFHNDYRDVITAFDCVVETGRPLFNRSNQPVKSVEVKKREAKNLLKAFVKTLNKNIKNNIKNEAELNYGWKNVMPNKTVKETGWEKQMTALGLPTDIYGKSAKKSSVRIIKIDRVDKFETDSQIRIDVYMILQKLNISDQMVVKVSFVMDKDDLNADRNFFKNNSEVDLNVHLESIFIVGYLTDQSYGSKRNYFDFYTFEDIEKDNIMDQHEIFRQLRKKYADRQIETNGLTIQFSPETGNNIAIERLKQKNKIYPD
jgi:hypothetical protein